MTIDAGNWESLAPWEKAAQWHEAAPHISAAVMALAQEHAKHQWRMERDEAEHRWRMDHRLWITQLVAYGVGLLDVAILAVVGWHYGTAGGFAPGIFTFAVGSGLTVGTLLTGRSIGSRTGPPRSNTGPTDVADPRR